MKSSYRQLETPTYIGSEWYLWFKLPIKTFFSRLCVNRGVTFSLYRTGKQLCLLLLALTFLSGCAASEAESNKPKKEEKRPIPVVAATATRQNVPLLVRTTGTVQSYSTVSVKSQVAGLLTGVFFREGQEVRKGQLLFTIDSRPLQAALDGAIADRAKAIAQVSQAKAQLAQAQAQVNQAKANVTRDLVQAKNADVQAKRYTSLLKEGAVSRNQAEQFTTTADAQKAVVDADRSNVGSAIAAVESAKANLQNTQAAISAADAAIDNAKVQLSYASIYAPGDGRLGKLNFDRGNLVKDNDTTPLVVISQIRPIYVEFSIPQRMLPDLNKYQAQNNPNAIVVPATAVQTGQKGPFVYVIKPDKTVELRQVTIGQTLQNQTAIETGLQAGDRIVVDGQFNLVPGAIVQEKPTGEATQPQSQGQQQE